MITIFTPTFNRRRLLRRLKNSIDSQTCKDFEWIIVDDGSSDGTEEMVNEWLKKDRSYSLSYYKQANQGKHIAFNYGVTMSKGEWFICVDSDDTLTPDAVSVMKNDLCGVDSRSVGIVYPQRLAGVEQSAQWEAISGKEVDIMDLKEVYGIPESAILLRKELIAGYPFPVFGSERFLPESWLYHRLIQNGKFQVRSHSFYVSEYLEDGLTKNIWKLWADNSIGALTVLEEKYVLAGKYSGMCKVLCKIKCIINLNTICIASKKRILENTPSKAMSILFYFPSLYFYHKRFNNT